MKPGTDLGAFSDIRKKLGEASLEIVRTNRRKTISFEVRPKAVRILAPKRLRESELSVLLDKRLAWISRKLQEVSQKKESTSPLYCSGESLLFKGKKVSLVFESCSTLSVARQSYDRVKLKDDQLILLLPKDLSDEDKSSWARRFVRQWYWEQAKSYMIDRTHHYAQKIGVKPLSLGFYDYKARWGTCTSKGDITYNPRLIMAPESVIDYVIVHELCHLIELNHSRAFWRLVSTHYPAYLWAKNWLKQEGFCLAF